MKGEYFMLAVGDIYEKIKKSEKLEERVFEVERKISNNEDYEDFSIGEFSQIRMTLSSYTELLKKIEIKKGEVI